MKINLRLLTIALSVCFGWGVSTAQSTGSQVIVYMCSPTGAPPYTACDFSEGAIPVTGIMAGTITPPPPPPQPPTISCATNPSSIMSGASSTVTAVASSPTNRSLTYSYSASAGSVIGNGATATYSSAGASPGVVTLTCNVADDQQQTASATTQVTIQSQPPPPPTGSARINFTDIDVADSNAYIRVFGSGFGSSGTLTIGGGSAVTNCALCSWSDTAIIAQVGSAAKTGSVVVNGSNGVPFTVTPTTYLYLGPKGSDSNAGTFAAPILTWKKAATLLSGSKNMIVYLLPGTNLTVDDGGGYRTTMSLKTSGASATSRIAVVGYPGGTATVGSTAVDNGPKGWSKNITIANLNLVGHNSALDAEAGNWRVTNNSMSCPAPPSGLAGTACVLGETGTATDQWWFYGNNVHDTGGKVDKTYHAVYFSTNANHVDFGWNRIGDNFKGYCRSLIFHSTGAANLFDLHVHDNVIHESYCDGIAFASVDPSKGTIEAYNNVLYNIALATNPYGVANESGIAVNTDPSGSSSGTVQVYNNTIYNAGAYTTGNQNGCFAVVSSGAGLNLTNNICQQPNTKQPYIQSGSTNVTGTSNTWFGAGSKPSFDASGVNVDPLFTSPSTFDFSLQSRSPAKASGTTSNSHYSPFDIIGTSRGTTPSMGAYQ